MKIKIAVALAAIPVLVSCSSGRPEPEQRYIDRVRDSGVSTEVLTDDELVATAQRTCQVLQSGASAEYAYADIVVPNGVRLNLTDNQIQTILGTAIGTWCIEQRVKL